MIFVTVGTHEQQFNRLVKYMDEWAKNNDEKVIIQTGYSTYEPKYAEWSKIFPYQEMIKLVDKSRIVISHGGPSSFIMPLQVGKTPIVVPRREKYDEHVNDHQVRFAKAVSDRMGTIIVVEELEKLEQAISCYDTIISKMKSGIESNNKKFNLSLSKIVDEMMK